MPTSDNSQPKPRHLEPWVYAPALVLALPWTNLPRADWDVRLFMFLNQHPLLPDWFWSVLSVFGLGLSVFILLSAFVRTRPQWSLAFVICLLLAGGLTHAIKRIEHTPRPAALLAPPQVHVIGQVLRTQSMPSGHTVSAFALCAIVLLSLRTSGSRTALTARHLAGGALVSLWCVLIALSRIEVGAHWPSDVLVGAGLGWVCGATSIRLAQRWQPRWPLAGRRFWLGCGLAQLAAGVAMVRIDTGYPLALAAQWLLGLLAAASGLYHLSLATHD